MLIAILIIVSLSLLISLVNTAIILLLGSALVQLIEKLKSDKINAERERPIKETEKPWYTEM